MNDDNVKPTDLQNNDITRFGQENINYTNKSTSNVVASDSSVFNKKNEYFNIGKVPPGATEDPDKEKRKLKRLLFILIVFIVIALIGFGIHFYLSKTRTIAENAVKTKFPAYGCLTCTGIFTHLSYISIISFIFSVVISFSNS